MGLVRCAVPPYAALPVFLALLLAFMFDLAASFLFFAQYAFILSPVASVERRQPNSRVKRAMKRSRRPSHICGHVLC